MKIQMIFASMAMAITFASANQASAQVSLDPAGPAYVIGWSSSAALCQTLPGSAHSTFNVVTGTVTFAPNAYGTIGLICSMPGIMNQLAPADVHQVALSFSNPHNEAGCTASVYFVDRTTGRHDGWISDPSQSFSGVWTANVTLSTATLPLANHTYDVDVYLYRPQSAGNSCDPVATAVFMEGFSLQ